MELFRVLIILAILHCRQSLSTQVSRMSSRANTVGKIRGNIVRRGLKLTMTTNDMDNVSLNSDKVSLEMKEKLLSSNYYDAFQILKKNPLIQLNVDDVKLFLNNIDSLVSTSVDNEKRQTQLIDACVFLYKRLERQNILRGFGCIDGEYPEKGNDVITPSKLEELTGINISALTPKQRTTNWQLVAILIALSEYIFGESIGIDSVFTLIPASLFFIFYDQLFLKGAIFETVYQKIFPDYRKKVITHEAGHFLVSYLLGVPIRGCVTNAWDSIKYPEILGQAGTIYYDNKFVDELSKQRVTRSSLDRLSVIVMAGIAAEALYFSKAEGGATDEKQLIQFFTIIQPPWNILRIQSQARWAATQAILLIKEHREAFEAVVRGLEQNKPVGDIIVDIEANLPSKLPSEERIASRQRKQKSFEVDILMRFIQRMTWRVGGVLKDVFVTSSGENYEPNLKTVDGFIIKPASYNDSSSFTSNQLVNNTDSHLSNSINKTSSDSDTAVKLFTERIRQMENAVKDGNLKLPVDDVSSGGIWINGLKTMDGGNDTNNVTIDANVNAKESNDHDILYKLHDMELTDIDLSSPVEGFEERIATLQANGILPLDESDEFLENSDRSSKLDRDIAHADSADIKSEYYSSHLSSSSDKNQLESDENSDILSASSLLSTRRGYQIKLLENMKKEIQQKAININKRLIEIDEELSLKTLVRK